jgi:hypothetical protein
MVDRVQSHNADHNIKQTLKIGHFFGTSENAVRIQIAIALIAFVLLRLAHDDVQQAAGGVEMSIKLRHVNCWPMSTVTTGYTPPGPAARHR